MVRGDAVRQRAGDELADVRRGQVAVDLPREEVTTGVGSNACAEVGWERNGADVPAFAGDGEPFAIEVADPDAGDFTPA